MQNETVDFILIQFTSDCTYLWCTYSIKMRDHTILRVVFLWMVLLTFMDANPQAIKMEEETGDPCDNIDTMSKEDECFRKTSTEATMGVRKNPMSEIHLCVHRCFSKDSKDKVDATTEPTMDVGRDLEDAKKRMMEKLGKARDKIGMAMKSRHKACNDSSVDLIHYPLSKASAYVYQAMRDIEKLDATTGTRNGNYING